MRHGLKCHGGHKYGARQPHAKQRAGRVDGADVDEHARDETEKFVRATVVPESLLCFCSACIVVKGIGAQQWAGKLLQLLQVGEVTRRGCVQVCTSDTSFGCLRTSSLIGVHVG